MASIHDIEGALAERPAVDNETRAWFIDRIVAPTARVADFVAGVNDGARLTVTRLACLLTLLFILQQPLSAQASPSRPDSVALAREARSVYARGVTLAGGTAADRHTADSLFRQAAVLFAKAGAHSSVADAFTRVGTLFREAGEPDSAKYYVRRALTLERVMGNLGGEAAALNNLAGVFQQVDQLDSALANFRSALQLERELGNQGYEAGILYGIGTVFRDLGQLDSALFYFRRALPIMQSIGKPSQIAMGLGALGMVFYDRWQLDSALTYTRQAWLVEHEGSNRILEDTRLQSLGLVFFATTNRTRHGTISSSPWRWHAPLVIGSVRRGLSKISATNSWCSFTARIPRSFTSAKCCHFSRSRRPRTWRRGSMRALPGRFAVSASWIPPVSTSNARRRSSLESRSTPETNSIRSASTNRPPVDMAPGR